MAKSPESGPRPEDHKEPEIINIKSPGYGSFGHKFFEVTPGVIAAAKKIAEKLHGLPATPNNLQARSALMREFSGLALSSQRLFGERIEDKNNQISNETDQANILRIINLFLEKEIKRAAWQKSIDNQKLPSNK